MSWIKDQRGITLIEMVIVSVMIGVVSAMAIPRWLEVMPKMRAKSEIRAMLSSLREARSLAISTQQPYGVNFDYTKNQYTVFLDNDQPDLEYFSPNDSIIAVNDVQNDVTICFDTFGNGDVIFRSDGSASKSGAVCIATGDYMYYYNLDVLASTGRVKAAEGYPGTI